MSLSSVPSLPLGGTSLRVPPLILAAWSFAGPRGPLGASLSPGEVERAFHELGASAFFVTPGMTNLAEGVRRLVRAGHRERMTLVSMAGIPAKFALRSSWRRCTRALSVDRIDVLLLGWVQGAWYLRPAVWEAMTRLKEEGRVGALGFSCHNRPLAARLASTLHPPPDVLMIRYNAAHRGAESEVFSRLPQPAPGVIAYTATRWGELLEARPGRGFAVGLSAADCYRFALSHPAVTTVLCGARSFAELDEDVAGVLQGPVSAERLAEIRRFGDSVHAQPARRASRFMFDR